MTPPPFWSQPPVKLIIDQNPKLVANDMPFTIFDSRKTAVVDVKVQSFELSEDEQRATASCQVVAVRATEGVKAPFRAESPVEVPGETTTEEGGLNLYERGFRHIPPVGFLPIEPDRLSNVLDRRVDRRDLRLTAPSGLTLALIESVERLARIHFDGTNVIPYFVVAVHDDDILEDIRNAFDKDPISLALREEKKEFAIKSSETGHVSPPASAEWMYDPTKARMMATAIEYYDPWKMFCSVLIGESQTYVRAVPSYWQMLVFLWRVWGLTLDDLANREVEIVKVMIPLQGMRRKHPIVDGARDDARKPFAAWFPGALPNDLGAFGSLPRHFVVYVKQRVALLDCLYAQLDGLARPVKITVGRFINMHEVSTKNPETIEWFRAAYVSQPVEVKEEVTKTLMTEAGRSTLVASLVREPELRQLELIKRYVAEIAEHDAALKETIDDDDERKRTAIADVTGAYAIEYPAFAALEVALEMMPPDAGALMVREIARAAEEHPAVDAKGRLAPKTIALDILHGTSHRIPSSAKARLLQATARRAFGERKISEVVDGHPSKATIDEVVSRTEKDAVTLLGGAALYKRFARVVKPAATKMANGLEGVAAEPPATELVERFRVHLETAAGDAVKAFHQLKREFSADRPKLKYLKQLDAAAAVLGPEGFRRIADLVFRPGGGVDEG